MYGMATICCAILCVLSFFISRMDLFVMFLIMFVILTVGFIGDDIARRKGGESCK